MNTPSFFSPFLFACGFLALVFPSCAHRVGYKLGKQDSRIANPIPYSVKVLEFQDEAPVGEKILVAGGGHKWRTNAQEGYEEERLSQAVSRTIAEHLEHSNLFAKVYYPEDSDATASLELSGVVRDYNAMGKVNEKAEKIVILGSTFGWLPGALGSLGATSFSKTDVLTRVDLGDLKLTNTQENRVVWSKRSHVHRKNFRAHFMKADADEVYEAADDTLREAINEMIQEIADAYDADEAKAAGRGSISIAVTP